MTDKESDIFKIKKETKQGDPLSSLLLKTVLQVALKDGKANISMRTALHAFWREVGTGTGNLSA